MEFQNRTTKYNYSLISTLNLIYLILFTNLLEISQDNIKVNGEFIKPNLTLHLNVSEFNISKIQAPSIVLNKPILIKATQEDLSEDLNSKMDTPRLLRCSCTMPTCITSNYMCISKSGACFTKLKNVKDSSVDGTSYSHHPSLGCVEMLNKPEQTWCLRKMPKQLKKNPIESHEEDAEMLPGVEIPASSSLMSSSGEMVFTTSHDHHQEEKDDDDEDDHNKRDDELIRDDHFYSGLECCHEDVCNYRPISSAPVYVHRPNTEIQNEVSPQSEMGGMVLGGLVLAVLVCGVAIIALMFLATGRMLIRETKRHRLAQATEQYYKGPVYYHPAHGSPSHTTPSCYLQQISKPTPLHIFTHKLQRTKEFEEIPTTRCSCGVGTYEERRPLKEINEDCEKAEPISPDSPLLT